MMFPPARDRIRWSTPASGLASTRTFSIFRPDLLPSLLGFLGNNAHVAYPQRVFECGDAVEINGGECRTTRKICAAWADSKVNLTQMKAVLLAVLGSLGIECSMEGLDELPFIRGRCARIRAGDKEVGVLGEIHPDALDSWQIPVPVLAMELYVGRLYEMLG